jgi:nucleotide-binding universal stress UspA family protein
VHDRHRPRRELGQRLRGAAEQELLEEPLAHLGELKPTADLRALRQLTEEKLEEVVCLPLRQRNIPYSIRILQGLPAQALADAGEEAQADLLVVGARRQGRFRDRVLGSTSKSVPQLTSRPVTVVHLQGRAGSSA